MAFDVLPALRSHLISRGLARDPDTASALAPLWLEPRKGVPGPGERPEGGNAANVGDPVVLGAFLAPGVPVAPFESPWRTWFVDVRIRARKGPQVRSVEAAITAELVDRREWVMGGVNVIESGQSRALQAVAIDEQGFDFVVAYSFVLYAS